jgi:hypothetical protein
VADPIPACAVMIMDLFLLESIAELVAFVAVVCCPVGADGKDGGGGPSPFPGALPRAITSHTLGVLLPSRWALGVNDEPDPGALPRAIVWHNLGLFLQFFWPSAPLRIGEGLPFWVDLGFAML